MLYKHSLSFIICFLMVNALSAQIADIKTHNIVKDSIVAKFNRNDFKGIYALADTSFKSAVSENDLINFLKGFTILGKIKSSSLLSEGKETNEYRLQCSRKSLKLTLGVANATSFTSFGLDMFRLPADRTRATFPTDNPLKTSLDSVVQKAVTNYMSNKNVSGISIGVIKDGIAYSYNFGEVKKGTNKLTNNNTIYEIGSVSKTFTGILLANAVLEGKLKLEDDIRKYLDGSYPNLEFNGTPIQVVNLANHTSRITSRPVLKNSSVSPMDQTYTGRFDSKTMNDILKEIKIDTLPGTRREYSNFAVCVLGTILEKVYGMSYEQLIKKYISTPYKMTQTKINLTKQELRNFAQGYSNDGTLIPYWVSNPISPVGGIRSTVSDMLLYMQEQLNVNNKAAALSHQLTFGTEKNGKGLLWGIDRTKSNNNLRWSHDGSTDGFSSLLWVMPELNAGVVLLTNNGDFFDESFNNEIFKIIYQYLIKKAV